MTSPSFDVVVVGGRCAGAPLATHLARAGLRVALVDRSRFPSDVASTHTVQPNGVASLRRLGVYDELVRLTTPIERATFAFDDARLDVDDVRNQLEAPLLCVRRITLDDVLLRRAADAGAAVQTETAVTGLLGEGDRVVGVDTTAGPLRAQVVIGADGTHSTVARLVGAEEYAVTSPERTFLWSYRAGVSSDRTRMWLGKIEDWAYLACPTDDDLWMVAIGLTRDSSGATPPDRAATHAAGLAAWPELQAAMAGTRIGPVRAMARWHGYFRRSAGPGWALVGDAGHFKDPSPGQGIADALRQAERLAADLIRGLGGSEDPDRVLQAWWTWRDRDAWPMYWLARDMGAAGPSSALRRQLFRDLIADEEKVERLGRVLNHELAPGRLFSPAAGLEAAWHCLRARPDERRSVVKELGATAREEARRWSAARSLDAWRRQAA